MPQESWALVEFRKSEGRVKASEAIVAENDAGSNAFQINNTW